MNLLNNLMETHRRVTALRGNLHRAQLETPDFVEILKFTELPNYTTSTQTQTPEAFTCSQIVKGIKVCGGTRGADAKCGKNSSTNKKSAPQKLHKLNKCIFYNIIQFTKL